MIARTLAIGALALMVSLGSAHGRDKGAATRASDLDPKDLEVIAVMEILKMLDLAQEMELAKEMDHLVEERQNEPTTD